MKKLVLRATFCILTMICLCGHAQNEPSDCVATLKRYIPAEFEMTGLVVKGVLSSEKYPYWPTDDERKAQLTEQYWATPEYQEQESLESFIDSAMLAIEEVEAPERLQGPLRAKMEIIISASNVYARHFDPKQLDSCIKEVVMMQLPSKQWMQTSIDHQNQTITLQLVKSLGSYRACYSAPVPLAGVRLSWTKVYPALLERMDATKDMWEMLCEDGQLKINDFTLTYKIINDVQCSFVTSFERGDWRSVSEDILTCKPFVRILQSSIRGPKSLIETTFEYVNDDVPWPTTRRTRETDLEFDHLAQKEVMRIVDVLPEERINFTAIHQALIQKYADYEQIEWDDGL